MDDTLTKVAPTIDYWANLTSQSLSSENRHVLFRAWQVATPLCDDRIFDAFESWCFSYDLHSASIMLNFNRLAPGLFAMHKYMRWEKLSGLLQGTEKNALFTSRDGGPTPATVALCALFRTRMPRDDLEKKAKLSVIVHVMQHYSSQHWDRLAQFSEYYPRFELYEFLDDVAPENKALWASFQALGMGTKDVIFSLTELASKTSNLDVGVAMPDTLVTP